MLVDFNEQAIKNLKDEIDGNNVSGEAHVTPRTSVTVRMTPDNRGDSFDETNSTFDVVTGLEQSEVCIRVGRSEVRSNRQRHRLRWCHRRPTSEL